MFEKLKTSEQTTATSKSGEIKVNQTMLYEPAFDVKH